MTIEDRFEVFDRDNPQVFTALRGIALDLRARGVEKFGIRVIWERLRWLSWFKTTGDLEYKLNDHYHALYARKLMGEVPELRGFFHTRERRA